MLTEPKKRYSDEFYDCKFTQKNEKSVKFRVAAVEKMRAITNRIARERKENPPASGGRMLIDDIIDVADSEQQINDLCLTYTVAGFHTTGNRTSFLHALALSFLSISFFVF